MKRYYFVKNLEGNYSELNLKFNDNMSGTECERELFKHADAVVKADTKNEALTLLELR